MKLKTVRVTEPTGLFEHRLIPYLPVNRIMRILSRHYPLGRLDSGGYCFWNQFVIDQIIPIFLCVGDGTFFKGYYRVNYDERNWRLIIKQLQEDHEKISTLSRAQLLDDAFNLARTGRLSYEILFEVCAYLRNEKNFVPWKSALENFRYIDTMLSATSTKSTFQVQNLICISTLKSYFIIRHQYYALGSTVRSWKF